MGPPALEGVDLYAELESLPPDLVGEIIGGRLIAMPRPAWPHANAGSVLGMEIGTPYQRGRGGPGGWWIIDEPEIHFVLDVEVVVPDIAGWQRERLPRPPRGHKVETVPDWVCEILSPSTAKLDRAEKMPPYARHGVRHLWLVDPLLKTLEVYALNEGRWTNLGNFKDEDEVCIAPFDAITIQLADLWMLDEADEEG